MVKIKSFATDVHSLFRNWPAAQNNFMVTEKVKPFEKVQGVSLQDSFKLILLVHCSAQYQHVSPQISFRGYI